jgi:hypothetical protein
MNSIIRMTGATRSLPIPADPTRPIKVNEGTWRLVVSSDETAPARRLVREAWFAFRRDAEAWAKTQDGFEWDGYLASCATNYFGPTDAPANCWFVSVERTNDGICENVA